MIERLTGRFFHKEAVSSLVQSILPYKHLHWHPAPSLTKTFSSFELISLAQNLLGFLTWESHECTKCDLQKCFGNVQSSGASSAGSPGFGSPLMRNPLQSINKAIRISRGTLWNIHTHQGGPWIPMAAPVFWRSKSLNQLLTLTCID